MGLSSEVDSDVFLRFSFRKLIRVCIATLPTTGVNVSLLEDDVSVLMITDAHPDEKSFKTDGKTSTIYSVMKVLTQWSLVYFQFFLTETGSRVMNQFQQSSLRRRKRMNFTSGRWTLVQKAMVCFLLDMSVILINYYIVHGADWKAFPTSLHILYSNCCPTTSLSTIQSKMTLQIDLTCECITWPKKPLDANGRSVIFRAGQKSRQSGVSFPGPSHCNVWSSGREYFGSLLKKE